MDCYLLFLFWFLWLLFFNWSWTCNKIGWDLKDGAQKEPLVCSSNSGSGGTLLGFVLIPAIVPSSMKALHFEKGYSYGQWNSVVVSLLKIGLFFGCQDIWAEAASALFTHSIICSVLCNTLIVDRNHGSSNRANECEYKYCPINKNRAILRFPKTFVVTCYFSDLVRGEKS